MTRAGRLSTHPSGRSRNIKRLVWLAILMLLLAPPALARFGPRTVVPVVSAAAVAPEATVAPPDALSTVYFAAGTTQIRPRDMSILDAHAVWQRDERKRVLVIEGHTDGPGDNEFSREIGEQRARSAKAYLVTRGVIADRIMTESRGGGRPSCKEKTATCRALNRRATVSREVRP
jgi:outer membrane protein OmpA-like peptidoglycan-associated protein